LVFAIALIVALKKKKVFPGLVFFLTLLLYSGGRFIIDFWRNEEAILWKLSFGQFFSLVIFLAALITIILLLLKSRTKGEDYEIIS
jgi:prolipoprotein diacylglyceryltransferase